MTVRRPVMALWLLLMLCLPVAIVRAQSLTLFVSGVTADSTSPAPSMTLTPVGLDRFNGPITITLELSLDAAFRAPFYVNVTDDPATSFHLDSLLTEHERVFFRARAIDGSGLIVAQAFASYPVRSWLRLVDPARATGTPLTTRTPRFVWSSPPITVPPGLWIYDLSVINSATGQVELVAPGIQDTSYVFPDSLQSSTSYRWQVHARTENGPQNQQVTVTSAGTFVITSSDQPTFTLFYPNFPNPFGQGARAATTCFWFDLAHPSTVSLVIYDVRLRKVRTIVPGILGAGRLPVGAYGRLNVSAQTGCDDRIAWDGRDDTGRYVPVGVYYAVFNGDGVRQTVKMLYKGP
jgi:hypothetical protein